jgi:hypothetical protein
MVCNPSIFLGSMGSDATTSNPFSGHAESSIFIEVMNSHMSHDPSCPPVPNELPSNIPKFEGKTGEDRGDHVTTFHLWFSSDSLNDDSIFLRLFQCTLMGVFAKWYIEIPGEHMLLSIRWYWFFSITSNYRFVTMST